MAAPTSRRFAPALVAALAVAAALTAGACGGDSAPVLSGDAAKGQQLARDKGCTNCHSATGARSEGPTFKGLADSAVTLADGTTVAADDAYLARSITDPRAQVVAGYRMPMVAQAVTDAEVALLVAYIRALK